MKIAEHNEFEVPFSSAHEEAFTSQFEEVIHHAGCLLVEWANGDNLIMSDCREGFAFFTFFSGTIHRWKVSIENARTLAKHIASDRSSHCGIIKAKCAVAGTSADEGASGGDPRDLFKRAA